MPVYPITMPATPELEVVSLRLVRQTGVSTSQYTGKQQRSEGSFALWAATGALPELEGALEAGVWRSFFTQLRGRAGSFNFRFPGYTGPSTGYVGAIGVVAGASQTGTTLNTSGWANSAAIFRDGDYFSVNGELKMVTEGDVNSDGTGLATINFEPALRTSPANLQALVITSLTFEASMQIDEPEFNISPPFLHRMNLDILEVF